MKRIKEASQYFIFLHPHTPYSNTQSIPNPLMDDDGSVVYSIIPHQEIWSSEPRNTKIILSPLHSNP